METVTIDRHLYLTEDGSKVVEEADPEGRFLWAAPGDERPLDEAERLGAVKSRGKSKDKAADKPKNKGTEKPSKKPPETPDETSEQGAEGNKPA